MAYAGLTSCGMFGMSSVCLKRRGETLVGPSPSRLRLRASDVSDSEDELFLAATAAATDHGQCATPDGKRRIMVQRLMVAAWDELSLAC